MPKDPVTSGKAEAGVFAYVQACAAVSGTDAVCGLFVDSIVERLP
ncbi:hypothetical protein ACWD5Q_21575 [Streptomyces sp. NPDC002513]